MSIINNVDPINFYNYLNLNQRNPQDKPAQNEKLRRDRIANKIDNENYIYEDPKKTKGKNEVRIDPIKRPIRVDESNNIFYINHNGENETVKVEPREYNLTELSGELVHFKKSKESKISKNISRLGWI